MRTRISTFIVIIQTILLLAHWFVYATWTAFWGAPHSPAVARLVVLLLAVSFVGASLLAFRYNNIAVRAVYIVAATWLGAFGFFFCAAFACWIIYAITAVFGAALPLRT